MAFKIKRFIPELSSPLKEVAGPGKGKYKRRKNTTDRKVVRQIARQASKDSEEGKSTLIETGNSGRSQKGGGKATTYDSKGGNEKVKKREIKKALKNVNAGRGDKVVVDGGKVNVIKAKTLTKDEKRAAYNKKKAEGQARLAAAKAKRLAEVAAKRKALKAKQENARAKKKK